MGGAGQKLSSPLQAQLETQILERGEGAWRRSVGGDEQGTCWGQGLAGIAGPRWGGRIPKTGVVGDGRHRAVEPGELSHGAMPPRAIAAGAQTLRFCRLFVFSGFFVGYLANHAGVSSPFSQVPAQCTTGTTVRGGEAAARGCWPSHSPSSPASFDPRAGPQCSGGDDHSRQAHAERRGGRRRSVHRFRK